eukprot:922666-Prorocentrum_lima.AAC.1
MTSSLVGSEMCIRDRDSASAVRSQGGQCVQAVRRWPCGCERPCFRQPGIVVGDVRLTIGRLRLARS